MVLTAFRRDTREDAGYHALKLKMQVLDQQRLDVADKTRSNIFGWRGQFTPEFVEYLLDETETGAGLVMDPFCGSGTVLRECAARDRPVHGFEINPAAYAMSRFFTLCGSTRVERLELMAGVERILRSVLGGGRRSTFIQSQ